MGARVRLKSGVDFSRYPPEVRVILRALQRYGMFLADNGSNWFVSGAPDDRWNNDNLAQLRSIIGNDLEFVDQWSLMVQTDSAEARAPTGAAAPAPAPPRTWTGPICGAPTCGAPGCG